MNPVEIYKILPKTNCGRCPQKTCMAFALSLLKGEVKADACPEMSEQARQELSKIKIKDWKAELIEKLQKEIKEIDLSEVAEGIGAELRDGNLIIRCFGTDYTVAPDGEITTSGHINPWIKILLLHYIRTAGKGEFSGRWVSFSELKSGMVKEASFRRDCEEPLRELLDKHFPVVERMLLALGATPTRHEASKYAWQLKALPKLPVLILYWPEEDGEPSALKILFDSTADRFLDVESIIFVLEGLINIIEHALSAHNH